MYNMGTMDHPIGELFEHVDDLAQLIFHKTEAGARILGVEKIRKLGELVRESRLTASTKSVVVANPSYMADQIADIVGSIDTPRTGPRCWDCGVRSDASSTNDRILQMGL